MRKIDDFDVMRVMGTRKADIKMFPPSNFKRCGTGKEGYGEVTIAVDNSTIQKLNTGVNIVFALYAVNHDEYKQIKKELEEENNKPY